MRQRAAPGQLGMASRPPHPTAVEAEHFAPRNLADKKSATRAYVRGQAQDAGARKRELASTPLSGKAPASRPGKSGAVAKHIYLVQQRARTPAPELLCTTIGAVPPLTWGRSSSRCSPQKECPTGAPRRAA